MTGVGSPLYEIAAPHAVALWALAALPVVAWLFGAVTAGPVGMGSLARRILVGYRTIPLIERALVWLLLASAAVHLGLAVDGTHQEAGLRLAFVAQAGLLGAAVARMLTGRSWRRLALVGLGGAIVGYWFALLSGEPPDQVGLATELAEILAFALVAVPVPVRRWRGLLGSAAVIGLVVLTDVAAWTGAVAAGGGVEHAAGIASHEHGHGAVPAPGMRIVSPPDREPTPAERAASIDLLEAIRAGIASYADPAVAAAAGYQVEGLFGTDFHAGNPAFEADGRALDPARPETLVYALNSVGRPVLLGALYLMPTFEQPGPTIGGPLTVWHAHEHVCLSVLPPALTGLLSPLGACPAGSFDIPRTAEMIHVWTVPGAPQPFGDLDPDWMTAYLASTVEP